MYYNSCAIKVRGQRQGPGAWEGGWMHGWTLPCSYPKWLGGPQSWSGRDADRQIPAPDDKRISAIHPAGSTDTLWLSCHDLNHTRAGVKANSTIQLHSGNLKRHVHFETVRGNALDLNLVSTSMAILPLGFSILNSVRWYIGNIPTNYVWNNALSINSHKTWRWSRISRLCQKKLRYSKSGLQ